MKSKKKGFYIYTNDSGIDKRINATTIFLQLKIIKNKYINTKITVTVYVKELHEIIIIYEIVFEADPPLNNLYIFTNN